MMRVKVRIDVFGAHRGMDMIRVLANHPDATLIAACDKYQAVLKKVCSFSRALHLLVKGSESFLNLRKQAIWPPCAINYKA